MTSSTPQNYAAWADRVKSPFRVGEAPTWPVGPKEVEISNKVVAINPADCMLLDTGMFMQDSDWPYVFGLDTAGEISRIGSEVKGFNVGDRVLANSPGVFGGPGSARMGGFQLYSISAADKLTHIPDSWRYTDAVVFPLALATASGALFPQANLALEYPTVPPPKATNGRTILVWGASSSVGSVAVLMLAHAGYSVLATCSPKNAKAVEALAEGTPAEITCFDYKSADVVEEIAIHVRENKHVELVGAFSAAQGQDDPLWPALVAEALKLPDGFPVASSNFGLKQDGIPKSVRAFAVTEQYPVVARKIIRKWLPAAMAANTIKAVPDPMVVGKGLESVQKAVDMMREGVSGRKLVVEL